MSHKAGFVNLIGKPNVGKSTLMNALVGEKLSIITPKAQTTRHRIKGIVNAEDYQIVFSDTPGILDPAYTLHEKMMDAVRTALEDADIILYLVEPGEKEPANFFLKSPDKQIPLFVVINKVDLSDQAKVQSLIEYWKEKLKPHEVIPISALHHFNIELLLQKIIEYLPESPAYFEKDALTDRSERFFAAEIIREKIFLNYAKEIPYSCDVIIESFKEEPEINKIRALLYVERESQKGIIIGHKGAAIKKVGIEARKDMENFFSKKVFLEMNVKVREDWRNKETILRNLGYDQV